MKEQMQVTRSAQFIISYHPFWPKSSPDPSVWCFIFWSHGSVGTPAPRWVKTSHWLCTKVTFQIWAELLTAGKGNISLCLQCEAISFVWLRTPLPFPDRLQAIVSPSDWTALNFLASISPIRWWSLLLAAYMYEYMLKFRDTLFHSNAHALSRLPLPVIPTESGPRLKMILVMEHLAECPVIAQHIHAGNQRGPLMFKVFQYIHRGWPVSSSIEPELSPF